MVNFTEKVHEMIYIFVVTSVQNVSVQYGYEASHLGNLEREREKK